MTDERYIWPQPEDRDDGELHVLTLGEIRERADQEEDHFFENLKYWKHDPDNRTLTHISENYEVNLERFRSKKNI